MRAAPPKRLTERTPPRSIEDVGAGAAMDSMMHRVTYGAGDDRSTPRASVTAPSMSSGWRNRASVASNLGTSTGLEIRRRADEVGDRRCAPVGAALARPARSRPRCAGGGCRRAHPGSLVKLACGRRRWRSGSACSRPTSSHVPVATNAAAVPAAGPCRPPPTRCRGRRRRWTGTSRHAPDRRARGRRWAGAGRAARRWRRSSAGDQSSGGQVEQPGRPGARALGDDARRSRWWTTQLGEQQEVARREPARRGRAPPAGRSC